MTRARIEQARRSQRRRRRWRVLGAAVVVLAAVAVPLVLFVFDSDKPSVRLRSELVAETGEMLPVAASPTSYRIVYRIESYGSDTTTSTEEVTVRRPFDGRVIIRDGDPPGGEQQLDVRGTYALAADYSTADSPQVSKTEPRIAFGDSRLDASLDDLVSQGLFVPRERRRALGRECQVYRTGSAIETLEVTAPTGAAYADICIDASGLVLEEIAVVDGEASVRVTAVEISDTFEPADDAFTIEGEPLTLDAGGAELTELDPATTPVAGYWQFATVPDGYERRGRYLLKTPNSSSTEEGAAPLETYLDVFVNGTDILIVRQGTLASQPEVPAAIATSVEIGALGSAQFVPGVAGSTVAAQPREDWFVHVVATLPSASLQQIAGTLAVT